MQINGRVIFEGQQQKLINSLRNMQLCMLLKKRKILTNSKVVFYMHLQLIKDNILSVVFWLSPALALLFHPVGYETLKRMNRRYTSEEFYEKCEILRKYFEKPALTTDVIVGFPQETEEEFETTYEFLKKICFYETHIFKYSKREGTKAC